MHYNNSNFTFSKPVKIPAAMNYVDLNYWNPCNLTNSCNLVIINVPVNIISAIILATSTQIPLSDLRYHVDWYLRMSIGHTLVEFRLFLFLWGKYRMIHFSFIFLNFLFCKAWWRTDNTMRGARQFPANCNTFKTLVICWKFPDSHWGSQSGK